MVIPTESMYAVVTDAFSIRGTAALREFKDLDPSMPLSVLVPQASTVSGITRRIPQTAHQLMEALWPGELTLLLDAGMTLSWDHPDEAPVAVRMPLHPLALSVLQTTGPMASTGAHPSGTAPITTSQGLDALEVDDIAVILDAGDLSNNSDTVVTSTVVDCTTSPPRVVRQGSCDLPTLRSVIPEIA
jgi:tRNA threonylcarbamoyl adenosine modification protein (Sua5/YciO/YrdC/YwlC family)